MKKLCIVVSLVTMAFLAGCGVVDTASERNRRIGGLMSMQSRMIVDDIDFFLLLDRSSSLTQYHPRIE